MNIHENVQRTAANLVTGLEGMSYGKGLRTWGLLSFEQAGVTLLFSTFSGWKQRQVLSYFSMVLSDGTCRSVSKLC